MISSFFPCNGDLWVIGFSPAIKALGAEEMIHTKDHKTAYIFDPWHFLGLKRRRLMDESWAALFREHILCELPVNKVAPYFSEGTGRPTKELYTALGVLVLQQMHDLTDEETVSQLAFNLQWHYALDIADESDQSKYLCPKTLWNIRSVVIENHLEQCLFERSADVLARVFKVDASKQRIDSVHIKSNMRRLGRIGIFAKSIHGFLVNLKRQHEELLGRLDQGLVEKYLPDKALGCFSLVKPSEAQKTLEEVSGDLFDLVQCFADEPEVCSMYSYRTLLRVLKEHCEIREEEGGPAELKVKPSREIASDSLQNPSDPDATYDGHKGQGYQVQVMETYCTHEDEQERAKTLNLITHVEVQRACESDTHALLPALESTLERGLVAEEVLADSLYGSDDNCHKAESMGVEVVSPVMGSTKEGTISLSEFRFSDRGKIIACPQGHVPVKTKHKKNRYAAAFECAHCSTCPMNEQCPVKPGKKHYHLRYDEKTMRIAKRRMIEHGAEFKEKYRWRAGIEATMSAYDRTTGVKRLRVRGFPAVRYCVTLKAIGVNLLRATAVRKARRAGQEPAQGDRLSLQSLVSVVKEHVAYLWGVVKVIFSPIACPEWTSHAHLAL
jgi:hypothetical protein